MNGLNPSPEAPVSLALGTFDGVHLGHRAVIARAVQSGLTPAVLSITPNSEPILTDAAQKRRLMAQMGVLCCQPIALDEIRHLSPRAFFHEIVRGQWHARQICCGFNFRFGKNAQGDTALLADLCDEAGITLCVVPPVNFEGAPVSSTRIRQALERGLPEQAAAMLGRRFSVDLPVVKGNRLGHKLGFPTLNQPWPKDRVLPALGVYATRVTAAGKSYTGVTNIGVRPTVGGGGVIAETHLIGGSGDFYGQTVTVALAHFLRPEQPFDSPDALRCAIARDVDRVKAMDGKE